LSSVAILCWWGQGPGGGVFLSFHFFAADGNDTPDGKPKEGRTSGKAKASKITALKKASTPVSRFAAFRKKAHKKLFGWMDPK
jgi:hypothetical protein